MYFSAIISSLTFRRVTYSAKLINVIFCFLYVYITTYEHITQEVFTKYTKNNLYIILLLTKKYIFMRSFLSEDDQIILNIKKILTEGII